MIWFQQADGIERAFEAEGYYGQKLGGGNFLFENSKYFHLPGMYGTSNNVEDSADWVSLWWKSLEWRNDTLLPSSSEEKNKKEKEKALKHFEEEQT